MKNRTLGLIVGVSLFTASTLISGGASAFPGDVATQFGTWWYPGFLNWVRQNCVLHWTVIGDGRTPPTAYWDCSSAVSPD